MDKTPSSHLEDCTFYGKQLMDGDLTKRNKVFVSYQSHFLSYVKGQSVASLWLAFNVIKRKFKHNYPTIILDQYPKVFTRELTILSYLS